MPSATADSEERRSSRITYGTGKTNMVVNILVAGDFLCSCSIQACLGSTREQTNQHTLAVWSYVTITLAIVALK